MLHCALRCSETYSSPALYVPSHHACSLCSPHSLPLPCTLLDSGAAALAPTPAMKGFPHQHDECMPCWGERLGGLHVLMQLPVLRTEHSESPHTMHACGRLQLIAKRVQQPAVACKRPRLLGPQRTKVQQLTQLRHEIPSHPFHGLEAWGALQRAAPRGRGMSHAADLRCRPAGQRGVPGSRCMQGADRAT
jgi:hypothetical protein